MAMIPPAKPAPDLANWTVTGPYGGVVTDLDVDPTDPATIYASTRSGLFKSTDGGAHWRSSAANLPSVSIRTLVIHPTRPSNIYVSAGRGIWRSTDGGGAWEQITSGERMATSFPTVTISADAPDVILAGNTDGVWRSANGGRDWTLTRGGQVFRLEASATAANIVYMTEPDGLFKSTDGGLTFDKLPFGDTAGDVAVSPVDPNTVFATAPGIQKSTDGGETWTHHNDGIEGVMWEVEISPSAHDTIYAGGRKGEAAYIARSDDGGTHWRSSPTLPGGVLVPVIALDPSTSETVFVGTFGPGVFKSTDGGGSFADANHGITAGIATAVASVPGDSQYIYVGLYGAGLYRSTDGGSTWETVSDSLARTDQSVYTGAIEVTTGDPPVVFASMTVDPTEGARLYRSDDHGETWTLSDDGIPGKVRHIIADPEDPNRLFAAVSSGADATAGGVYMSLDGGYTWKYTGPRHAMVIALSFHPASGTLVAATSLDRPGENRLFISRNSGEDWEQVEYPGEILSIATVALGHSPDELYAGSASASRIAKSIDGGRTWATRQFDPSNHSSNVHVIQVDPINPSQVYAGTDEGGLWISSDSGDTWTQLNPGVFGYSTQALDFNFAGTSGTGSEKRAAISQSPSATRRGSFVPLYAGMGGRAKGGLWRVVPAPDAYRRPRVEGKGRIGATLTCNRGRWSRARSFRYAWFDSGDKIRRADKNTYRVRASHAGSRVSCRVTARGPGGLGREWSRPIPIH